MTSTVILVLTLLFIIFFFLGFIITPWLSILSFVPLLTAAILLFKKRYIKK